MSTGGVQRQLRLPPAPDSARAARRLVADVLAAARAEEFVDTATLLTSELVTNGIVHANTDLRVVVEAATTWVRVEVADDNPALPSRRDYDESAMTGRGLEMVELLADDFGVDPIDHDGKRVWFRLGAVPGTPQHEEPHVADPDATPPLVLRLLQVPVDLYCAWQPHAEALLREAVLAAYDDDDVMDISGDHPLAARALGALADAAAELFALHEDEVPTADVTLRIDADAVPWFPIMRDLLNRAAVLSHAGRLLVPPSLPEVVAVRNWICDEVARQVAGLPPTPWAGFEIYEPVPPRVAADLLAEVRNATQSVIAADVSNRICAVSRPAAQLLGWEQSELEGRRLVTIVPPRLRDRHIAGFTRHLVSGSSTILGRSVPVPALRQDGSEIDVLLHIERRSNAPYHSVFVATLSAAG